MRKALIQQLLSDFVVLQITFGLGLDTETRRKNETFHENSLVEVLPEVALGSKGLADKGTEALTHPWSPGTLTFHLGCLFVGV